MNKDILICGVGGQGTVLASKIIASAAMSEGNTVHSAETIGMAQRGGSVTSHVRIGDNAFSPLIPYGSADILLAFEPAEAVRNIKYLKKGGVAAVNTAPTAPVTESLAQSGYDGSEAVKYLKENVNCIFVNSDEICEKFGSAKFFNIVMLGIAAGSGKLGIDSDTVLKKMTEIVPERFVEINTLAFNTGLEAGKKSADKENAQ